MCKLVDQGPAPSISPSFRSRSKSNAGRDLRERGLYSLESRPHVRLQCICGLPLLDQHEEALLLATEAMWQGEGRKPVAHPSLEQVGSLE